MKLAERAKGIAYTSALLTASIFAVNWALAQLNLGVGKGLFATVPVNQVITETAGQTIWNFAGGYLPLSIFGTLGASSLFILFLSALIVVTIGSLAVEYIVPKNFKKSGKYWSIATVLFYGTLVGYLYFVGLVLPDYMAVLGVLVHMVAVIAVASGLAGLLKVDL